MKPNNSLAQQESSSSFPQKSFEVNFWRIFSIKMIGYESEEGQKLLEAIASPKRFWLLALVLIIIEILTAVFGNVT